jgi:hypothetical protein
MKIPARPSRLARRNPLGGWFARVPAVVVLAALAVMLAACGDSGPPTGIIPCVISCVDTSTLAGTWKGTVDGTGGRSGLTTILNADSTYSGQGEIPFYCKVTGKWTVSGGQFTSTGTECGGAIVTSVAPVASLRLTGTWSANNGSSGTFTVAKQ